MRFNTHIRKWELVVDVHCTRTFAYNGCTILRCVAQYGQRIACTKIAAKIPFYMSVYCKFSVGSYLQRQLGEWIVHLGLFIFFFFFNLTVLISVLWRGVNLLWMWIRIQLKTHYIFSICENQRNFMVFDSIIQSLSRFNLNQFIEARIKLETNMRWDIVMKLWKFTVVMRFGTSVSCLSNRYLTYFSVSFVDIRLFVFIYTPYRALSVSEIWYKFNLHCKYGSYKRIQ